MQTSRTVFHHLGSLWLAVVILLLTIVTLAAATIFESSQGPANALKVFYLSWWFRGLLGALALNVFSALLARFTWSWRQAGFGLAHVGILIVLAAALLTNRVGVNGQLIIENGQTVSSFRVPENVLHFQEEHGSAEATVALDLDSLPVSDGGGHPWQRELAAGNLTRISVLRYLPDMVIEDRVHNDNPEEQMAIEVSFSENGKDLPAWIFHGDNATVAGIVQAAFLSTPPEEPKPQAESTTPASKGTVQVVIKGEKFEMSVEECMAKPVPLGTTAYSLHVLQYLSHALVGSKKALVNASEKNINPAIEAELIGPEGKVRRLAFSRFPDYQSIHKGAPTSDISIVLVAKATDAQALPIEVFVGKDKELWVRFSEDGKIGPACQLTIGQPIDTLWPRIKFSVLRRFDHARSESVPAAASSVSGRKPQPALQVQLNAGEKSKKVWLRQYQPRTVKLDSTAWNVQFGDRQTPLGFDLMLKRFHVGTYPGGETPRSYESHVTITDPNSGGSRDQIISMNHPVSYGGYTFYQSSYQETENGMVSILAVSRDPGELLAITGYIAITLGMLVLLFQRLRQQRRYEQNTEVVSDISAAATGVSPLSAGVKSLLFVAALLWSAGADSPLAPPGRATPFDLTPMRELVVQHSGRWMPMDTWARDMVEEVTGGELFQEQDPLLTVLGWTFDPEKWKQKSLIPVGPLELRKILELPEDRALFSLSDLTQHKPFWREVERLQHLESGKKPDPLLAKVRDINERISVLEQCLLGRSLRILPHPSDRLGEWQTILAVTKESDKQLQEVKTHWEETRKAFLAEDLSSFKSSANALAAALRTMPAAYRPSPERIAIELQYNRLHPFRIAWVIMLLGTCLGIGGLITARHRLLDVLTFVAMVAGFGALSYGLYLRWSIAGRIPASNMFESLLLLSWGMGAFSLFALLVFRQRTVMLTAMAMGALALILADCLPIDQYIRPIPPVLLDTIWMSIHVPIIMVGYSVLTLAVLIAHAQIFVMAAVPKQVKLAAHIDTLHYTYLFVGSILLFVGIATGSMWAASSWGRYWGWDPKEVWSLIAFLAYMANLHVRANKAVAPRWIKVIGLLLGHAVLIAILHAMWPASLYLYIGLGAAGLLLVFWIMARGPFAFAVKSILAFWSIIMTYVGVNYVLTTGLHSYGFGSGAVVRTLFVVVGIDAVFLLACFVVYLLRRTKQPVAVESDR